MLTKNVERNIDKNENYNELLRLEIFYIKKYNTLVDTNPEWGCNLTCGGQGAFVSEQTREKISKSHKKRFESATGESEREKMSNTALTFFASERGRIAKEKLSTASKGRKLTVFQRELLSELKKSLFASDKGNVTRKKLSIANTGKTHSEETRKNYRSYIQENDIRRRPRQKCQTAELENGFQMNGK